MRSALLDDALLLSQVIEALDPDADGKISVAELRQLVLDLETRDGPSIRDRDGRD